MKNSMNIDITKITLTEAPLCQDCDKNAGWDSREEGAPARPGKYMLCPYDLELYERKTKVCLCEECARERERDI